MEAEKYPFDFDALNKGDTISPEIAESIVKVPRSHRRYSLKAAGLAKLVERELGARGKKCTVCVRNDAICILTDSEAAVYTKQQGSIARRKERLNFMRALHVDVTNLGPDERKAHERRLVIDGQAIAAASRVRRKLAVETHKRVTPTLGAPQ